MLYAAFFRNLNLGRPRSPNRQQFESAFVQAGATRAESFLTNGTLVFEASGVRAAQKILADASRAMATACGLQEPGFVRDLPYLRTLVASEVFATVDRSTVYDCYVTFLTPKALASHRLPAHSATGNVVVVHTTPTEALCVAYLRGKSPGSPNAFAEKHLASPATTRAWNTVVRLVAKYS